MDITGVNVNIKSWCKNLEKGALEQAVVLTTLPFLHERVCLMADCHQGYGMPIGGVIATKGVVIPNAVGVDIGCGVITNGTSIKVSSMHQSQLKKIISRIKDEIPVGFKKRGVVHKWGVIPVVDGQTVVKEHYDNAQVSLGTLGGGNHFIELQENQYGYLQIMIHTGSRNLGKQICEYYNDLAIKLNKQFFNYTKDLAFLPLDSDIGRSYMAEMHYALEFAKENRKLILQIVESILHDEIGVHVNWTPLDIHHNYASMENHFGKNVLVHRKGAIKVNEGDLGIVPGSQGSKSYIVEGLGNRESFNSCSHGAGRKMGRKQAQRELDLQTEIKKMDDMGIIHNITSIKDLDETVSAYKDIEVVMSEQKDLIRIVRTLTPIATIKG